MTGAQQQAGAASAAGSTPAVAAQRAAVEAQWAAMAGDAAAVQVGEVGQPPPEGNPQPCAAPAALSQPEQQIAANGELAAHLVEQGQGNADQPAASQQQQQQQQQQQGAAGEGGDGAPAAAPPLQQADNPPPPRPKQQEYLYLSSTFVHQKLRAFSPPCGVEVQVERDGVMLPDVYCGQLADSSAKGYYALSAPPRDLLLKKEIYGIRLKTDGRIILQIKDRARPLSTDEGRRRVSGWVEPVRVCGGEGGGNGGEYLRGDRSMLTAWEWYTHVVGHGSRISCRVCQDHNRCVRAVM
jgi:hypothetical protein